MSPHQEDRHFGTELRCPGTIRMPIMDHIPVTVTLLTSTSTASVRLGRRTRKLDLASAVRHQNAPLGTRRQEDAHSEAGEIVMTPTCCEDNQPSTFHGRGTVHVMKLGSCPADPECGSLGIGTVMVRTLITLREFPICASQPENALGLGTSWSKENACLLPWKNNSFPEPGRAKENPEDSTECDPGWRPARTSLQNTPD
ncbi:uncharacterized protein EI90DRAFT_3019731 [Cantharellus anzutake]|uniref:uncharacterized protein n=1 Tax=Cantharellus anzutake TaxID=1750568 RepID=UPI001906A7EF|nr:uncharacterized protein EI90DRAFT_3019731 [Cantharellus anzutake]KAF8324163.1 hypothetical protein EI90DRAFT_3019731 [Cantharellus anzutake]